MTAAVLAGKSGRSCTIAAARYGSVELKRAARRDMTLGVGISAVLNTLGLLLVAWLMASRAGMPVPKVPGVVILIPWPPATNHAFGCPGSPTPPTLQPHAVVTPVPDVAPLLPSPAVDDPSPPSLSLPGDNEPASGSSPATAGLLPSGRSSNPGAPGAWVDHEVEPVLLAMVKPQYTDMARSAGIEGRVKVWMLVGSDGRVERAEVRQGVPLLNDSALEAARRWTFRPALAGGRPVAVWVEEVFDFRLR